MARPKHRGQEVGLREYLLEEAVRLREICGRDEPKFWDALSPRGWLIGREPFAFYRYQLPDDHPDHAIGGLYDRLVLTEGDSLRSE